MTTTSPPYPGRAPATARRGARVLIPVGAVLAALGLLAGAGGTALVVAFGSSGALDSGPQPFTTTTAALISDAASFDDLGTLSSITGRPTLTVTSESGNPAGVFIGVAAARAVDEYLAGVAVDEVEDVSFDPFDATIRQRSGDPSAPPPAAQDFWVASSSSPRAELTWPIAEGDYRLVVMNGDGSPNVVTRTQLALELPRVFAVSVGVLIGGALTLLTGVVLLWVGIRGGTGTAGTAATSVDPVRERWGRG